MLSLFFLNRETSYQTFSNSKLFVYDPQRFIDKTSPIWGKNRMRVGVAHIGRTPVSPQRYLLALLNDLRNFFFLFYLYLPFRIPPLF